MFDAVCAFLLRLYPAEFRRAYGSDSRQLIRDRARYERSPFLRLRLLMDLTMDLLHTSVHWRPTAVVLAHGDDTLCFDVIEAYRPRPTAIAAGMLTSMVMFASFALLFHPQTFPSAPAQLGDGSGVDQAAPASGDSTQPVASDPGERHALIAAIAANLKQRYVEPGIGLQLSDALLADEKNGHYDSILNAVELAGRITDDIHERSRTLGIPPGAFVADVIYSERRLPAGPPPPITAAMREQTRQAMLAQNCWFQTVEKLPHNVGYVKLNGFPDPLACHETTSQAMTSLNGVNALIVDLRDNFGGYGESALQIAGYLFDRPTYLYDPRPNSPVPSHTESPSKGNTLVDTPVFVLTSSRTQSAAEYFAYNLKMLKRVTVIGEKTAGHQHSGTFIRINDHFGMGIQETALPANPYAVKGWEVIGVEPDAKVSSADALAAATKLAGALASRRR